jgi:Protein of unknown function (DUF1566)
MKKAKHTKLFLFIFLLIITISSQAQIGIGTAIPDASAQLDITSTTKGVLVPRVASTSAVVAPAEGLLVYQTNAPVGFYVYKSGVWTIISTGTLTLTTTGTSGAATLVDNTLNIPQYSGSSSCSYSIGQNVPALGGFIFYLDVSGCHGLVCATTDQSTGIQWYNGTFIITNSAESGNGAGKGNTQSIIIFQGAGNYAAKSCTSYTGGGFTDWYLPSKYELNLMWLNVGQGATNIGGFNSSFYWSSTENSSGLAWNQYFGNGVQNFPGKNTAYYVRAVRAF